MHRKHSKLKDSTDHHLEDKSKTKKSDKHTKKKHQFHDIRYSGDEVSESTYDTSTSSRIMPQPPAECRRGAKIEGRFRRYKMYVIRNPKGSS